MYMKNAKKMVGLFLVLVVTILGHHFVENFSSKNPSWMSGKTTCSQRNTCSKCVNNGYDSTGSLCYWCGSKCINPDSKDDAKYYNSSCSSSKKCPK